MIQVPAFAKVARKAEVVKDHLESEIAELYLVLPQLLAEEGLLGVRCFSPEFWVVTCIESLGVARFQRVVQPGPVYVGQAEELRRQLRHEGNDGFRARLAEVECAFAGNIGFGGRGEVDCSWFLLASFAEHAGNLILG